MEKIKNHRQFEFVYGPYANDFKDFINGITDGSQLLLKITWHPDDIVSKSIRAAIKNDDIPESKRLFAWRLAYIRMRDRLINHIDQKYIEDKIYYDPQYRQQFDELRQSIEIELY